MRQIIVSDLSARSILLELTADGKSLGNATGFIVSHNEIPYLITNWHVVTGQDPDNHNPLNDSVPNEVIIYHHARGRLGEWIQHVESLEDLCRES
jgi:hypothetical protein